jgi:hypothetical protein
LKQLKREEEEREKILQERKKAQELEQRKKLRESSKSLSQLKQNNLLDSEQNLLLEDLFKEDQGQALARNESWKKISSQVSAEVRVTFQKEKEEMPKGYPRPQFAKKKRPASLCISGSLK